MELFDAAEVVAYLEASGRGLNPEAADDVAAHVALAAVTSLPEPTAVAGVSALLCLMVASGAPLGELPGEDVLALAQDVDPGDALLVRELQALGGELPALAAHAEALADAAYSARSAFELLLRRHRSTSLPGHAAAARVQALDGLVAGVVSTLISTWRAETLVDGSDGDAGLALAVSDRIADGLVVAAAAGDGEVARWSRRRLRVHDVDRRDPRHRLVGRAVHLRQAPSAGEPELDDIDVLREAVALASRLRPDEVGVLLGPASALIDAPRTPELTSARDAALRPGFVRVAVRLPVGLLPRSPRRAMALWVLGPGALTSPGQRWLAVGELGAEELTPAHVDDLGADVLAVLAESRRTWDSLAAVVGGDAGQVRSRALRFLRPLALPRVLATNAGLRWSPEPRADAATPAGEVARLLEECGTLGAAQVSVRRGEGSAPRSAALAELVKDRECRVIKGHRLDGVTVHLDATGGVDVLGAPEVLGTMPVGRRRVDRLSLFGRYPSARLTEARDVVFVATPRPVAIVDAVGGSVVEAPARILRITPDGEASLLPDVLAEDVAAAGRRGGPVSRDWRRWAVRRVPMVQREPLRGALSALEDDARELRERLARVEAAAVALKAGVCAGEVVVVSDSGGP